MAVVSAVSGGPGPGASNPRINRQGGGYIGDAPAHKIGTGIKIPHPASNLKKREFAILAAARFGLIQFTYDGRLCSRVRSPILWTRL